MRKPLKRLIHLTIALCALYTFGAAANSVEFKVISQSGAPVHSAIISGGEPEDRIVMSEGVMDQVDRAFAPYVLPVQEGQKVAFPNSDSVRHHVYSFSEPKQFEMRLYSGRPEAPLTFDQSGVVVLGCNIHDNMVGYIYVTKRPYKTVTDKSGKARLSAASEISEVTLWHPQLSLDSQKELSLSLADLTLVEEDGQSVYIIQLDIPTPPDDPQAVANPGDRFSRFKVD